MQEAEVREEEEVLAAKVGLAEWWLQLGCFQCQGSRAGGVPGTALEKDLCWSPGSTTKQLGNLGRLAWLPLFSFTLL